MPDSPEPAPGDGSLPVLTRRVEAARRGEPGADAELARYLGDHPDLWAELGDLAVHAERAWLGVVAGDDVAYRAAVADRLRRLKAELAGPEPTACERLLAERAALGWLQACHADAMVARNRNVPLPVARYAMERQDRTQRRLTAALRELAQHRRLRPAAPGEVPGQAPVAGPGDGGARALSVYPPASGGAEPPPAPGGESVGSTSGRPPRAGRGRASG